MIPEGLIFCDTLTIISDSTEYRKGFILQPTTINLDAEDTVCVELLAYCLNADKSGSDYDAIYTFGPVTNHPELMKITNILKTKQPLKDEYMYGLSGDDEFDIFIPELMQIILWNITDIGMELPIADYKTGKWKSYVNGEPEETVATGKLKLEEETFLKNLP